MNAYLVGGTDPVLQSQALERLLAQLLADAERVCALEDFTVPGRARPDAEVDLSGAEAREAIVGAALIAAQSPPFMTEQRVIVVREVGNLTAADAEPIVRYLDDPLDTTVAVFVRGGGRVPDALLKKLKAVGAEEVGPQSEKSGDVLAAALRDADLKLQPDAVKLITEHVGENAGSIPQLVAVLASAYGGGALLSGDDVEPYLGDAGAVPIYELTNAIERGDVAGALETMQRLTTATSAARPKPMHALQILAMLHNQYRRLAHLDDPAVRTEADAVAALGGKVKPYPARKALDQARALGTDRIRRAYAHLHHADVALKGATAMPEDAVLAVLVARLAGLSGRARAGARRR